MKFLKRQFVRPIETVKRTAVFLTAALLISCSGGMDRSKVTPIAKPPVKTQSENEKAAEEERQKEEQRKVVRAKELLGSMKREKAAKVMAKYDWDHSGKLEGLEYCDWMLTSHGYRPPIEEEAKEGQFNSMPLLYATLMDGCVSDLERRGKNEFGIDDLIKEIDPFK